MIGSTRTEQTRDEVRSRIMSGELALGSRIREMELAEELGVARGTLRTALQALEVERLVVQRSYRSTHVATLSSTAAAEIASLRDALEGLACRLAAERMDDAGRRALEDVLTRMAVAARSADRAAMMELDWTFHHVVVQLSGHVRLQEQYSLLEPQIRLYLQHLPPAEYDLPRILAVHRGLADALQQGRVADAAEQGGSHNAADGMRMAAQLALLETDDEGGEGAR